MSSRLEDQFFAMLGDDVWGDGQSGPPGEAVKRYYQHDEYSARYVFSFRVNDGFELGIGFPDRWLVLLPMPAVRALFFTILRRYVSTWFGLRRWLWYKLLRRRVKRWKGPANE